MGYDGSRVFIGWEVRRLTMKNLLYLTHRIPFPPNKGDKIRSYHILKYLAQSYRIYLGTFIDEVDDWQYLPELESLWEDICCLALNPKIAKLKSLTGLLKGQPLTVPYYTNSQMTQWVNETLNTHKIDSCLVFSSAMAQFIDPSVSIRTIIDFVDVDSDKWLQYAQGKRWPASWIYTREGNCLLEYDRTVANRFDFSFFVSRHEVNLFQQLVPEAKNRIGYFNNGVDTEYFKPNPDWPSPYPDEYEVLVFTGAMDYWANVDAVCWFAKKVFPQINLSRPSARFYIVGSKPSNEVRQLEQNPNIVVTGRVKDIRPYLQYAQLPVAPLRIARGIQNKVLEAMAMAKPILLTSLAMEGIETTGSLNLTISDEADELAARAVTLLEDNPFEAGSVQNRDFVQQHYTWLVNIDKVKEQLAYAD